MPVLSFAEGATLPAIRFNPPVRDFYKHLRPQGKAPKLAIIAAMRKLLITANTIIEENRPWHPSRPKRLLSTAEGGEPVRKLLKAAGFRMFFLPPYSPRFNPIEEVFSKLKSLLRKANARTVETTWRALGELLDRFSGEECANFIRSAEYASI